MDYETVIGLETHVQLKTRSKMWCGCPNGFGAAPNTLVCPVCLGMPGVLPVPNEEALRLTVLTGCLLNCEIAPWSKFDRKNYFYPDASKNYQITQYDAPSTREGYLDFEHGGEVLRVRITRAHLEEDVGKSSHFDRHSGVDFNRAGVPLLEIVSEPDIRSADMAYDYLNTLKSVLIRGGVSDCDMEKGMVRCDVNVSVRPVGSGTLGAKVEIKNMNTFSGVRRALQYEISRQLELVRSGGKPVQETRRWDDLAGITESMRSKEDAHDYRYFPEPDLMPHVPEASWIETVRLSVPELPLARKQRFAREYDLPPGDAEVFANDVILGDYFVENTASYPYPKALANWLINSVQARVSEARVRKLEEGRSMGMEDDDIDLPTVRDLGLPLGGLAELVVCVETGRISHKIGQDVLAEMLECGEMPGAIVERRGWGQVSDDSALGEYCDQVIASHPGPVADFLGGKIAALNFLKGQVMKLSKGKANPGRVGEILEQRIRGQNG